MLWQATGGMDRLAAEALATRLADLALLAPAPGGEAVTMHDVIRDYLSGSLGEDRLAQLHATLLRLLGFDHTRLTYHFQGRDFRLTDVEGELVSKLLA